MVFLFMENGRSRQMWWEPSALSGTHTVTSNEQLADTLVSVKFFVLRNMIGCLLSLGCLRSKFIFGKESRYYLTFSYFFLAFVLIFTTHCSSRWGEWEKNKFRLKWKKVHDAKNFLFRTFFFSELFSTFVYIRILFWLLSPRWTVIQIFWPESSK